DYGYVSRGVCEVDGRGDMVSVTERTNIYYDKADEQGTKKIVYEEDGVQYNLAADTRVSMNFWGFTPRIFEVALTMFPEFVENNGDNPKSEFFIPSIPDYLVRANMASFKVIPTNSKWFGVTYVEDKPIVQQSIADLVSRGVYPEKLF
ncbi:MAG: nucleotidyltransferase, partial [Sphingobacterium sp.]